MKKLLLILVPLAIAAGQTKGDVANGKRLFHKNGCYQCHGTVGQGGIAGPRLAQTKLPLIAFRTILRSPPSSNMPPYRAKVMSDQEVADVFAYIQTFPQPAPAASIPLLNQ